MRYYLSYMFGDLELSDLYLKIDDEKGVVLMDDYNSPGVQMLLSKDKALDLAREIVDKFQNGYPTEKMPVAEMVESAE